MFFITNQTRARFYNNTSMTFLVQKESIDVIFKIKRGVYLTVKICVLSDERLLLACVWGDFWNRLKKMSNRKDVLGKLMRACPLVYDIFNNVTSPHFAYIDKEQRIGAVVIEMKSPIHVSHITDYLHNKVIEKAMELMRYNLNLLVELEEKCPFKQWKKDLEELR